MKVLLLGSGWIPVPPPGYGAVERHVAELAAALRRRGHEVDVFAPVYPRPFPGPRLGLAAALKAKRYDVVHSHATGVAAVLAALGVRYVHTSHTRHWMRAEGARERFGLALERFACRRARGVVALTPEVRALMLEAGVKGAEVVPNGVDLARFPPRAPRAPGPLRVVALGDVREHKQVHVAAEAARDVAEVRVVGPVSDPLYASRLEGAGAHLLGVLSEEELVRELAGADVLAHLSVAEALSLAVLEGMAAGLPVVASDICRRQVEDGVNGYLVPTDAPAEARVAAARAAFERLAADPALAARMGEAGRRLAAERFTWDAVAARVEAVYASASKR